MMQVREHRPALLEPKISASSTGDVPELPQASSGLAMTDGVEIGAQNTNSENPSSQTLSLLKPKSAGVNLHTSSTYSSGESNFIYSSLNRRRETIKLKKDLPDPKLPSDIRGKFYEQNNYELFSARGPVPADVAQGNLGDCYFLATLASLAQNQPDKIKEMIRDNGDGTFSVRFYAKKSIFHKRKPVWVKIDDQLPQGVYSRRKLFAQTKDMDRDGQKELWVALVEKAFAVFNDEYHVVLGTRKKGYDGIGQGGFGHWAHRALTGEKATIRFNFFLPKRRLWKKLERANDGHFVALASKGMSDSSFIADGIAGNHLYSVLETREHNGKRFIKLRNPWGQCEPGNRKGDGVFWIEFSKCKKLFSQIHYSR